jgi:hypothetical protein
LKGKSFIWCDHNEDGDYQVEEVELVDEAALGLSNPFGPSYWGNWIGDGLVIATPSARLAPSRFSEKRGVPIYEAKKIQPFHYGKLAPVYGKSEGRSIVTSDGNILVAHEPYVVLPDLTIKGGAPEAKPSSFRPPVAGRRLGGHHFVGSAVTKSPVGEVVAYNGTSWMFESAQDRVLIGQVFTGETGGWSTDLKAERGADVTGRKHAGETFFGHFVKAQNGNYYTVAGKQFHGICRIEGLDDFQVQLLGLKVSAADFAANEKLLPTIVASTAPTSAKPKIATFRPEPGPPLPIGDEPGKLFVAGSWNKDGLALSYKGTTPTGNSSDDWRYLFKTGFGCDLMLRTDPKAKDNKVVAGDRRLVFGPHKGQWIAVLYDYVVRDAKRDEGVDFSSPLVTTHVARVVRLPADEVQIKFQAGKSWTADVFLKWSALGIAAPDGKAQWRCDFGILTPDSGGTTVESRDYWSDRATEMTSDLGVEAQIHPGNWGTITLEPK